VPSLGDQIGRIFACRAIVYFGQLFNAEEVRKFWLLFSTAIVSQTRHPVTLPLSTI
jgi:hypothetical protein